MKEIKLNKLVLENFKCFQELEIDFNNGQDLVINGANGTGKTTIMDALNWLLFKKNSHGDQDFSVKPLDKNGNSKKSVVISVYGEFVVNGDLVTFKRTMEEQWTRKRGSKDATFTGNTYSYEINGVPASSEKAYKEAVADLCDETLFRLITNPHYFSNLDKKEKRKILMDALKTNIDDIAIITANEDLYELRKYIVANTIEELQSIKKKEIKELTKNLNEYVPRIDELSKLVDDTLTEDETNLEIENLKVQIDIVKDKIKLMSSSNDVQSNLALVNELNAELLKLKSELLVAEKENTNKKERQDEIEKSENKLVDLRRQDRENEMQIVSITSEIKQTEKAITTYTQNSLLLNEKINNLRNQAKEIFRKQFDESETICPCCNRPYEPEMVQQIKNNFNAKKSQELEENKTKGLATKKEIEETEAYLKIANDNLKELKKKKSDLLENQEFYEFTIDQVNKLIKELQNSPISENETILSIKSAISEKEQQIINAKANVQNNGEIKPQTLDLENELEKLQNDKFRLEQNIQNRKRMLELYDLQERDAQARVEAERVLALCEIFTTKKCLLIEDEINKMFSYVKFKLFETQINGGIAEVCYATVNGVPYDDVNSAGKINAGLDIIKTLQKEQNVKSFIFIDNAESITDIMPMENQMITLYVSKEDKQLSFENK